MITKIKIRSFAALLVSVSLLALSTLQVEAAPGGLDLTFGTGGKVMTDWLANYDVDEKGHSVAVQSDGKIVVAGYFANSGSYFVGRYNPDGSVDQSFGDSGFVSTGHSYPHPSSNAALRIQTDGKIIIAASIVICAGDPYCQPFNGPTVRDAFLLSRYNPDGSLDADFSTAVITFPGGACPQYNNSRAQSLDIQSNGKIVVAGYTLHAESCNLYPNYSNADFSVARLNTDGTLDTSFSGDGKQTISFSNIHDDIVRSVMIEQRTGQIVLAGYRYSSIAGIYSKNFALAKLNPNGSLDTDFGVLGKVTLDFFEADDYAYAADIQPDGKIVIAGSAAVSTFDSRFALARLNGNGSLDTTFGTSGRVTTNFGSYGDSIYAIALVNDQIIVAGKHVTGLGGDVDFALARYNNDGALDNSFSRDGKVTTDFYGYNDHGSSVTIQPDGKIVVAGSASNGNDYDLALARYLP